MAKFLSATTYQRCIISLAGILFGSTLSLFVNIMHPKVTVLSSPSTHTFDAYYANTGPLNDYEQYLSVHPEINERFETLGDETIIYNNPLADHHCRNAILYKENIDIHRLLTRKMNQCLGCFEDDFNPETTVWSREMIDFMRNSNETYYFKKEAVRFPWDKRTPLHLIPTYFMIAKSGSSSVYANLLQSFGPHWANVIHKNYALQKIGHSHQIPSPCGYTFVRNPITRFIAAYYTINKKIYNLHQQFRNVSAFNTEGWNKNWRFLTQFKEPDRFMTFVKEMIANSYDFSLTDPLSHLNTMIAKSFTVFQKSTIHFIGKLEYFDKHWDVLMHHCNWFSEHLVNVTHHHQMEQWGSADLEMAPDYADILGFTDLEYIRHNKTLYPAYYIVASNKTVYDLLVNYFWQDLVCFGYKPDFMEFKRFVDRKY